MSGLLAARVLADHFAQVTLVERDVMTGEAVPRRGVPQGRHGHALLPGASQIMDALFPGFLAELVDAGAPSVEGLDQMHVVFNGHRFFHDHDERSPWRDARANLYQSTRPFLESRVFGRVVALPNVDVMDGCDVGGVVADAKGGRVTGVRVTRRSAVESAQRDLPADLVVCATGRNGRAPAWLKGLGYEPPAEEEVRVDIRYVTQRVRLPAGSTNGLRTVLVGATAERPWGGFAFAQEGDQWIISLTGYVGHHPPLEREAWLRFADGFFPRGFDEALHASEPLEELHQHRFAASLRRRYDKLHRFPERLLVTGDALCSLNPVYGQGMTTAALEALALQDALLGGWSGLATRFFRAAAKPTGDAWKLSAGGDLALPVSVVPGPRPLPVRAVNGYVDRFQVACEHDPVMAWRFLDVISFLEPVGVLFTPDSLRRLASDRRARRRTEVTVTERQLKQVWP